jgi:Trypsin-like peptidase domain
MIGQCSGMRAQPFLAICCRLYPMPVHLRFLFVLGVLLASSFVHSALAEIADDSLLPYAVNVHRTPMQTWGPGYGIYLGKGLFITAAHVAGRGWFTRPKIAIAGQEYPTRIVKEGSFEGTDVTVLAVQESLLPMRLQMRRMKLCAKEPWPGEQVVTVVPEGSVRTYILSPAKLPSDVRKFSTVIADVARTGNSGSGVFDLQQRCLLGIMSRKISVSRTRPDTGKTELVDLAKYFVPAFEIRTFLPPDTGENLDQ